MADFVIGISWVVMGSGGWVVLGWFDANLDGHSWVDLQQIGTDTERRGRLREINKIL